MKRMKIVFFICILFFGNQLYADYFYVPGSVLLGINIGGGNNEYVYGAVGGTLNLNAEIIINTWYLNREVEVSIGFLANGSIFFGNQLVQGGLSLMPTFHVSFFDLSDWYLGIGFGISMHRNLVRYGVGLSTGFNIEINEWFLINMGMEIQGPQFFGGIGFKFKLEIDS